MRKRIQLLSGVALAMLFGATAALAAPRAELWDKWSAHDPQSTRSIDHSAWDRFLQQYVLVRPGGVNRVDYESVSDADKRRLSDYLDQLSRQPILQFNRDQQRAFWINLYNALTIKVILDHYPVESIRDIDISPGFFSDGPWGKKLLRIEGEQVSLDDVEHRILRPIWRDARIHYAVNCASIGCPNLQPTAFTAENSDALLTAGAREYVNHPRGAEIRDGDLVVSSIYEWFQADFGGSDAGVIAHLSEYAQPGLAEQLGRIQRIDDDRYDWRLNAP